MSLTVRVLVALVLGLAAGLIVLAHPTPALLKLVRVVEPVGILWVNAIRMTVVPLVVSLLITGVAHCSDMRVLRGIGWRTLAFFLELLVLVAAAGLIIVPPLFAWFRMDPATIATLRGNAAAGAATTTNIPGFGEWVVSVVPTNPVKAASDGAMLPLVVFALAFALALLKVNRRPTQSCANVLPRCGRCKSRSGAPYPTALSRRRPFGTRSTVTVRSSGVSRTSRRL